MNQVRTDDLQNTPLVASGSFSDIDEYRQTLIDWDLEVEQLQAGGTQVNKSAYVNSDLSYLKFSHQAVSAQLALAKRPGISFLVTEKRRDQYLLYGNPTSTDTLCCVPEGSEIDLVSHQDFHAYTFSASYDTLALTADSMKLDLDALQLWRGCRTFAMPAPAAERLRNCMRHLATQLSRFQVDPVLGNDGVTHFFHYRLLPEVIRILCADGQGGSNAQIAVAQSLIGQMMTRIDQHLDAPPSIQELADGVGITTRYAQQLFQRYCQMTPKQYIQARRLQAVRRNLRASSLGRGVVSEQARHLGFWHMGQFSRDYKRFFGELPKHSIGKAKSQSSPRAEVEIAESSVTEFG
ncbi:helix-turn-helix transcriptional regulator [Pseudomaricurvus alkylphenolicus]|jgi:AraC-like DNA-binding protein|uniref:helix-turn-helix transcriptional regulator n=1 Tax=Pseudomaricurvus alkylphenolicus TaxID=1306991 RepID=UPI001424987B|nr:helix-turn-helix domain-containing protein [Pseudomaricurvus alkylphenolicus]NIB40172.1 helix-turn-helix transcriptional regulator [Pseudomaricurvus alkylphenolicus]